MACQKDRGDDLKQLPWPKMEWFEQENNDTTDYNPKNKYLWIHSDINDQKSQIIGKEGRNLPSTRTKTINCTSNERIENDL